MELKAAAEDKVSPAQRTKKEGAQSATFQSVQQTLTLLLGPGLAPLHLSAHFREDAKEKRQQQEREQKTGSGREPFLPGFDHYHSCSLPLGRERYSQQVMDHRN